MSFKLEDCIAAPSQELLNLAKKGDLLEIASHYSIPSVKTSMLKHEIKNIIIQFFVDKKIFEQICDKIRSIEKVLADSTYRQSKEDLGICFS